MHCPGGVRGSLQADQPINFMRDQSIVDQRLLVEGVGNIGWQKHLCVSIKFNTFLCRNNWFYIKIPNDDIRSAQDLEGLDRLCELSNVGTCYTNRTIEVNCPNGYSVALKADNKDVSVIALETVWVQRIFLRCASRKESLDLIPEGAHGPPAGPKQGAFSGSSNRPRRIERV